MHPMRFTAALACAATFGAAQAATTFAEGFDDVASLAASGWDSWNLSPQAAAGSGWFQGNEGVFAAAEGAPSSYAAANFLAADSGPISLWLVTPVVQLSGSDTLSFAFRAEGAPGFADGLRVYVADGSATSALDFTTQIFQFDATPPVWISIAPGLPQFSGSVRIAFEYFGDAATANYLGLDSVAILSAVPEPSAPLLLSLGLAGIALRRRLCRH